MSRTSLTRRPVRAVLALTVGAASLVGLGQASAAPPVTYAITGVSPAHVEAGVADAFGVTITGKGFTRKTRVRFGSCADGSSVAPSTLTATKLVVQPPSCPAGPVDLTITESGVTSPPTSTLAGKFSFFTKPTVQALAPATAAVSPGTGPWTGGTAATVTVQDPVPAKAPVRVWFTSPGVSRPVAGKVDANNTRRIAFKVPPGLPGVQPSIAVSVYGIVSEPEDASFTYRSTIRTSPNVWVKGAALGSIRIDGAGFSKGTPTVTVCDEPAPLAPGKVPTDKTLVVTPPAWAPAGVSATDGGVCTVRVTVTPADGGAPETSAITAGSTFTYAAY